MAARGAAFLFRSLLSALADRSRRAVNLDNRHNARARAPIYIYWVGGCVAQILVAAGRFSPSFPCVHMMTERKDFALRFVMAAAPAKNIYINVLSEKGESRLIEAHAMVTRRSQRSSSVNNRGH